MSKWRPNKSSCLYVIPDVHGAENLLSQILKRILPLRKSNGIRDKIVFLGDYIDRGKEGHKVLDILIDLKKKYKDRIICLCGNHELMLLESLEYIPCISPDSVFEMWMQNGGIATVSGYAERADINSRPHVFSRQRVKDLIPQKHIEFLMHDLDGCYEEDNFVFVHGGCEPDEPPTKYDIETLCWDRSLFKFVKYLIHCDKPCPWEKHIITGHNSTGFGKPIIRDKFMMLDCGSPKRLLVVEMHTKDAFMALPFKKRLVNYKIKETTK